MDKVYIVKEFDYDWNDYYIVFITVNKQLAEDYTAKHNKSITDCDGFEIDNCYYEQYELVDSLEN